MNKSKRSRLICFHCAVTLSSFELSAHTVRVKKTHQLSGFVIVNKYLFESSKTGLFTCNNAGEVEDCVLVFQNLAHWDLQMKGMESAERIVSNPIGFFFFVCEVAIVSSCCLCLTT